MTQEEWGACSDPQAMIVWMRKAIPATKWAKGWKRRKFRLVACAAVRANPKTRQPGFRSKDWDVVETAERWAYESGHDEADWIRLAFTASVSLGRDCSNVDPFYAAAFCLRQLHGWNEPCPVGAQIVRDIFRWQEKKVIGPNLKDVTWTPDVLSLAASALANRHQGTLEGDRLLVLADAAEEAGGWPQDVLDHLRSPGPHRLGCWAADLCNRSQP